MNLKVSFSYIIKNLSLGKQISHLSNTMKKLNLTFSLFFIFLSSIVFAQGFDCSSAEGFCTGTSVNFPNSTGQGDGGSYGCLGSTPNQAWYYLQIDNSGNIDIHIEQTSTGGSGIDVDFICWGPFPNMTAACGIDFENEPSVDCSYSAAPTEDCNIPNAQAGEFYLLLLTNFSDQPGNIEFSQNGGTGTTDCGVLCNAPNASTGSAQVITCTSPSVTLSGSSTTAGVTYQWAGPGGFTSSSQNPTVSVNGTYTLTVTDPANPTCPATATQIVNLDNTIPNVSTGSTQTITCIAASVNITGSSTTNGAVYSWTGPGGYSSSSASNSVTTAGTYTLTVTTPSNGCVATAQQIVNINTTPPDAAAGSPEELTCAVTSINLTSNSTTPSAVYNWAGPGGYSAVGSSPAVTVPGTYTLTITDPANGCTANAQQDITSNTTPPDASAGGPQMLDCASNALMLSGSSITPGANYNWNGPFGYTSSAQNPSVNIAGTYTLTVTDPTNGCTDTAQQIVNSNVNAPNVSVDTTQTLTCVVSSATLGASSTTVDVEFSWTGPAAFTSTLQNPTVTVIGTYSLTVTDTISGCISYAQQIVDLNTTPPGAITGSALLISCTVDTVYLSVSTSSPDAAYSWIGPGTFTSVLASPPVTGPGTYSLTVTDTINGCTSTAQQIVNSDTTAPNISVGADQTLTCIVLSTNVSGGTTATNGIISWSGPNGFTSISTTALVSTVGAYVLTVTDTINGCTSTLTQMVNSDVTPPVVSTGATQSLTCVLNTANLSANSVSGATYNWNGPGGFSSISATPTVSSTGTYTVTATDPANGCSSTATQLVNTNTTPPPANAGPDQNAGCGQSTVTLSGASPASGPYTYSWTTFNGTIYSGATTLTPTVDSGTYVLTVTDTLNGCTTSNSMVVNMSVTPDASFTATPTSGEAPFTVSFVNNSVNDLVNTWIFGNGVSSIVDDTAVVYYNPGVYTATLYVMSVDGCLDSMSVTINVNELSMLAVPNIFTPNGDGRNDVFIPLVSEGITQFKGVVYDRWGMKMHEWNNENSGWDGKAKNGSNAPDGTYFYVITAKGADGKEYDLKGFVQILSN
jgi:gliding motility-associated-like protein